MSKNMKAVYRASRNGLILALVACATNPATGRREISLVSESQEVAMGREADPVVSAQMGGVYPDSGLQQYARSIGLNMTALSERPGLPWSFKVLDDELINAFALPGGYIYVTRGILGFMNSEAELAGVLSHEIGHVTARHSANQLTRAQLAQLGLGVGMIFSETIRQVGQAASTGLQLLFLKFGRDDERQADELGFRYMTRGQYDPNGMTTVMQMLDASSPSGPDEIPGWLSTHPDPGDRAQANQTRISQSGQDYSAYTIRRDEFLRQLDGMVWGEDPRHGYFIASRFLHPTLAFELTFPAGWRTQNSALSVQAMSAARDAAMSLSLASATRAADALRGFVSADGITATRTWRESINGLEAQLAEFTAQTEEGQLRGVVAYIEHGGAVYQVLGYGTAQNWPSNQAAALTSTRSFRRLTDRRYTDVEPQRIAIVQLPRSMTFNEFTSSYPSTAPADRVALLNQVAQDASIPAGRLMKRVVGGRVPTQ